MHPFFMAVRYEALTMQNHPVMHQILYNWSLLALVM